MKKPMYPRDGAGSFKVPSTKPGAIKVMCSLPQHLEIYTPHETFKCQTPETIDPGRTNPHAMWVNAKTHDVGSASPFVARTFIMASEVLKLAQLSRKEERDPLLVRMHSIKELLLQCVQAKDIYQSAITAERDAMQASGYKLAAGGRALEKFPVVSDLEAKVTAFLIAARRTITEICQIPGHIWTLGQQHSSLEHLINKELTPLLGSNHRLIVFLGGSIDGTRRIIELRNGQEHGPTTKGKKLVLSNFQMMPTNQIRSPVWFLEGEEPEDIAAHMNAIPDFLLNLAEAMFVGCVDAILTEWPPFRFVGIDPVDPECPVRYQLTIDASRMQFKGPNTAPPK